MLKRVELSNFKTFRWGKVELARLTLVLGANGAGKSNFFDALRFLKSAGDGQSIRDAIEGHATTSQTAPAVPGVRGGGAGIPSFGSGSTEFELRVRMEVARDLLDYQVRIDTSTYRIVSEELRSRRHPGPYVFSTHPETGPLEQRPDSPAIVARFHKETPGLNPRREFSPYEFIISQFRERRAESRVNEAVAEAARAELASLRLLELRPEILREYSPLGRSELGEHGENFAAVVWQLLQDVRIAEQRRRLRDRESAVRHDLGSSEVTRLDLRADTKGGARDDALRESELRLSAIRRWLSELTPRAVTDLSVVRAPTGEAIFALEEDGHGEPIPARSLSDGTLRFSALTFAALGMTGRQTLIIEELENGINPVRLSLLIRMLEQTTESSPDVQVIASTHAPGLLDYASKSTAENAIVIGWNAAKNCSHPVRLADMPGLSTLTDNKTLGDLQAEGWLQLAADR